MACPAADPEAAPPSAAAAAAADATSTSTAAAAEATAAPTDPRAHAQCLLLLLENQFPRESLAHLLYACLEQFLNIFVCALSIDLILYVA